MDDPLTAFLQILTESELSQAHGLCSFQLGEIERATESGKVEYHGINLAQRTKAIQGMRLEIAKEYEKRLALRLP